LVIKNAQNPHISRAGMLSGSTRDGQLIHPKTFDFILSTFDLYQRNTPVHKLRQLRPRQHSLA
jgi:hypothetical protein